MRYYRNYMVTTADLVHEQSKLLYPNNHSVGYSITAHKFVEVRNRQTLAIWKPSEFWKTLKEYLDEANRPTKDRDWKRIFGL